jgi:DNA mismatch repair protein MutH
MLHTNRNLPYDKNDPKDIENYAKKLIGKRFRDISFKTPHRSSEDMAYRGNFSLKEANSCTYEAGNKGYLGQFIEENYFFYKPNSNKEADFKEAGVELKVSPLKELKNGELRAKERIVLNIIDFLSIVEEEWETSSFLHKNELLLLVFYLHELEKERHDFEVINVTLWDYGNGDLEIIKEDWHKIVNKVKAGMAHELSERDTLYLGACPKGASRESTREQPFSDKLAMQRAFSLKQSYVNSIISRIEDAEPVNRTLDEFEAEKTFEDIVMERISRYKGMDENSLFSEIGEGINRKAYQRYSILAARMLGIKKNKIEEFEKADVEVKAIRLHSDGKPAESMSFPYFKYKEIVNESWEDSSLLSQLDKRFFFIIFQYDKMKTKKEEKKGTLRLKRGMFWSIPYDDLQEVRSVWEETVQRIKEGNASNLPKSSENRVAHVRPHGRDSKDTCETPQGEHIVKKCFWLNAGYIKEQIELDGNIENSEGTS